MTAEMLRAKRTWQSPQDIRPSEALMMVVHHVGSNHTGGTMAQLL
jgi:hypothetical protein